MASEIWFAGFEADGGNNWVTGEDVTGGDLALMLSASPSQVEKGGQTRLVVSSADMSLLGKFVTLTVSQPLIATTSVMNGIMEKDGYGKVAATFLVTGLDLGSSVMSATLSG